MQRNFKMNIKEKIKVMEAFDKGKKIEIRCSGREDWVIWKNKNMEPIWNFEENQYRIAPWTYTPPKGWDYVETRHIRVGDWFENRPLNCLKKNENAHLIEKCIVERLYPFIVPIVKHSLPVPTNIPKRFELTGEYRVPEEGDHYITDRGVNMYHYDKLHTPSNANYCIRHIARRVKKNALDQSIDIWEERAQGRDTDESCPLCCKYDHCVDCPVKERTGLTSCKKTPYINWYNTKTEYGDDSPKAKEAAKKELAFLKSLRDKCPECGRDA